MRATKLITRTVMDTKVRAKRSLLRLMLLFAREKMGTTMFLTGRWPFPPLAFMNIGNTMAVNREAKMARKPVPTNRSAGTIWLPGYV